MKKLFTILIITIFIGCAGETAPTPEVDIISTIDARLDEKLSDLEKSQNEKLSDLEKSQNEIVTSRETRDLKIRDIALEENVNVDWDEIIPFMKKFTVKVNGGSGVIISLIDNENNKKYPDSNVPKFKTYINRDKEGFVATIITNIHVIDNEKEVTVTDHQGNEYDALVIYASREYDLALLQICCEIDLESTSFSEDNIIGSSVATLGYPGTAFVDTTFTLTAGVISNQRQYEISQDLVDVGIAPYYQTPEGDALHPYIIQTDSVINGGNSGGPLVNKRKEIVGINTFRYSQILNMLGTNYGDATYYALSSRSILFHIENFIPDDDCCEKYEYLGNVSSAWISEWPDHNFTIKFPFGFQDEFNSTNRDDDSYYWYLSSDELIEDCLNDNFIEPPKLCDNMDHYTPIFYEGHDNYLTDTYISITTKKVKDKPVPILNKIFEVINFFEKPEIEDFFIHDIKNEDKCKPNNLIVLVDRNKEEDKAFVATGKIEDCVKIKTSSNDRELFYDSGGLNKQDELNMFYDKNTLLKPNDYGFRNYPFNNESYIYIYDLDFSNDFKDFKEKDLIGDDVRLNSSKFAGIDITTFVDNKLFNGGGYLLSISVITDKSNLGTKYLKKIVEQVTNIIPYDVEEYKPIVFAPTPTPLPPPETTLIDEVVTHYVSLDDDSKFCIDELSIKFKIKRIRSLETVVIDIYFEDQEGNRIYNAYMGMSIVNFGSYKMPDLGTKRCFSTTDLTRNGMSIAFMKISIPEESPSIVKIGDLKKE